MQVKAYWHPEELLGNQGVAGFHFLSTFQWYKCQVGSPKDLRASPMSVFPAKTENRVFPPCFSSRQGVIDRRSSRPAGCNFLQSDQFRALAQCARMKKSPNMPRKICNGGSILPAHKNRCFLEFPDPCQGPFGTCILPHLGTPGKWGPLKSCGGTKVSLASFFCLVTNGTCAKS